VRRILFKGLVLISIAFGMLLSANSAWANSISAKIEKMGQAEHISFTGASEWDYKILKLGNNKIKVILPARAANDFVNKSKKWKGNYLSKINVTKNTDIDSEVVLTMNKNVSYFDYLTDQPSSLIIDFYKEKKKKPVAKTKKKPKKVAKKESEGRKPASAEFIKFDNIKNEIEQIIKGDSAGNEIIRRGVFDSADPAYNRFKISQDELDYEKIAKNLQKNVFLRFPVLISNSSKLPELLEKLPLHVIKTKNKRETKEAQLVHRLYQAKSWAAFNKMYEYFGKTYPESRYTNLLRSLATSAYYNLWKQTNNKKYLSKAEDEFLKFKKKLPDSRVTEYWEKVLFYTSFELEQGLETSKLGEGIVKRYPLAQDLDNIKLTLADSYLKAAQYKEAGDLYNYLINNSSDKAIRDIASFTKPIIQIKKKKMKNAVEEYLDVKKEHLKIDEPGYYFNMAEAYFWKGDYYRSAQLFRQFIKKYPKHLMNNFAITRIGEIMQLAGFKEKRFSPIYFESNYRFKGLKGADIARMRLNSLKVPISKKIEVDHYIQEIEEISSKYDNSDMRYFKEIIISDTLTESNKFLESNSYLKKAYKRNPFSKLANKLKPRILYNLKNQVNKYLDKNDYLAAIELFEKNRETWLSNVTDIDFKKGLARSFEMAGMRDYALAYYVDYINEKQKKSEDIDTQVILSMATLYQKNEDYDNMDKYLRLLSISNDLSEKNKFDAIKLKFEVYNKKAAFNRAENILSEYHRSIKNNETIEVDTAFMLSDFYDQRAKFKQSLGLLKKMENKMDENHNDYYLLSKRLVKQYVKNSDDDSAIKKINDIKDTIEFKNDEEFIYYAGNLFMENKEFKKGKEIWSLVKNKDGLYGKMISEKLSHKKWIKNYGKYFDRIPAMKDVQKGEY